MSSRNRKKGLPVLKLLAGAALVVVMAAGGYFVKQSGMFSLREVECYGNKYLSEQRMVALMGIQKGESLLSLPSREVAGMLLESPWVKSVSLRKEYPSRLVVRIEEAVPAALLQVRKDTFFVDSEGNVLEKLENHSVPFLPVIVSNSARNPQAYREALVLAGVIKRKGLATEKSTIEITGVEKGPEELTMLVDGLTVKIGQGKYVEKLARLFELSDEIKRRHVNVKYVDLRFSNGVVVKPFKEAGG